MGVFIMGSDVENEVSKTNKYLQSPLSFWRN